MSTDMPHPRTYEPGARVVVAKDRKRPNFHLTVGRVERSREKKGHAETLVRWHRGYVAWVRTEDLAAATPGEIEAHNGASTP